MKTTVGLLGNKLTVNNSSYTWSFDFALIGTENQVKYALDLIAKDIKAFASVIDDKNLDLLKASVHLDLLKKETSAKWFIDNTGNWQYLIQDLRAK